MIWVSKPYQCHQEAVVVRSIPSTLRAGTPDVPAVPPFVQYLVGCFFAPLVAWLETLVLRLVLARCADHPLVQLAQRFDPAAVVRACATYYHADGTKGAPPTYSVDLLVRAEIVRSWADSCSDRDLEWHLASNLVVRFFVGLPLLAVSPDHSTLARFHAWLSDHQPAALFHDALAFLDQQDPEDAATTPQIVDTFAVQAPAALPPRVANLLLDLSADLFAAWLAYAPAALQRHLPPLDLSCVVHPERPLDALARQVLLVRAVALAQRLHADLHPHRAVLDTSARQRIAPLLAALTKVLSDEIHFDGTGYPTERKDKGSYRIISATDLDASFRYHDTDLCLGYNAAIATTATRIRAVVVVTGATPDSETPALLLAQQQAAGLPLPAYFVMDRAGGTGAVRASLDVVSSGQTQMVAYTPQAGGLDPTRFGPSDFRLNAERTTCTCPNGVTSTKAYRSGDGVGVHFRFLASQCKDCPLWNDCRGEAGKPKSHRTVFVSDYQAYVQRADAFNHTTEGKALLAQRWQVEPCVAWLARYGGCRRARRIGLKAVQFQLYQACAVRNLLRWLQRHRQ